MDVSKAVDSLSAKSDNTIALSSGVVLRGKQANPIALIAVMGQYPRPKPPTIFVEVMGRNMENTEDPDYIERVKSWEREQSSAILNAMILYGTEFVSKPKNFPGPDDNEWLDEYVTIGLQPRTESKSWRYLTWVTFKAVQNEKDLSLIKEIVGVLSGVREADVKAAETFPGRDGSPE
jgi:hypothetical protein